MATLAKATVRITEHTGRRTKSMFADDFRGIAISPVISNIVSWIVSNHSSQLLITSSALSKGFPARMQFIWFAILLIGHLWQKRSEYKLLLISRELLKKLIYRFLNLCIETFLANHCAYLTTGLIIVLLVLSECRSSKLIWRWTRPSSHSFAVYINDIVNHFYFNQRTIIGWYANDMLLIAPSLTELQSKLKLCELELAWLDPCRKGHANWKSFWKKLCKHHIDRWSVSALG